MINEILVIVFASIILGIGGFLLYLFFRKEEKQLENYYKDTVDNLAKTDLLGLSTQEVKTTVIVQTEHKYSYIRKKIKEFFNKLRKRKITETIIIFEKDPIEQRACIIREAVNNAFLFTELMDTKLTDTLIAYFSFKFASTTLKADKKLLKSLQRDYEESAYRDCVATLDDKDFSYKIVINPPPEKKPVLTELMLPMIICKSKEVMDRNVSFTEREKLRVLFSKFINGLYEEKIGILFVGVFSTKHYWELFSPAALRYSLGFIMAARGSHTPTLERLKSEILENAEKIWNVKFRVVDIWGKWLFDKREKDYYWLILEVVT
jgi:hypothetical protein